MFRLRRQRAERAARGEEHRRRARERHEEQAEGRGRGAADPLAEGALSAARMGMPIPAASMMAA